MKNLSIEKLEPRNQGTYHVIRKVNELCDTVNELVKLLQKYVEPDELDPSQPDSDSD